MRNWFSVLILIFTLRAEAQEASFRHITLKGVLESRLAILNKIREVSGREQEELKHQLFYQDRLLWGDTLQTIQNVNTRLDDNTLIELILKEVATKYQEIGANRSGALIDYNRKFDMGTSNYSGFSWSKPAGEYGFTFDRKLEPESGDKKGNWIVKDSLTFYVEASTFIKKLQEQGSVEVSNATIEALAGVLFKRTYQYHHTEKSYIEGLTSDFSKMFLGFLKFRKNEFLKLNPYDLITKDDQLLIKASGMAKIPITTGVDLNSTFGYSQKVLGQTLIKCLEDQSINIAGERGVQMEGTVNVDILGEFYNLVKIVFLAFEFDASLKEQKRWHLYLTPSQLNKIEQTPEIKNELYQWINLQAKAADPEQSSLKPLIDVEEKRREFNYDLAVKSIVWRTSETHQDQYLEFLDLITNNFNYFLKSITKTTNYIENIWATIFPKTIINMLSSFFGELPPIEYINGINSKVEFELTPADSETEIDTSKVTVNLKSALFFEVERKMEVYYARKGYFKKMFAFLTNYTQLNEDKTLEENIKNRTLGVPLIANSLIRVNNDGFHFFDELSPEQMSKAITEICNRYNIFKKDSCERDFKTSYEEYQKERERASEVKLQNLNRIVNLINQYANSYAHYALFFGEKNLSVIGSFKAVTLEKFPFTTYFVNDHVELEGPVKAIIHDKFPYLNSLYEFDETF